MLDIVTLFRKYRTRVRSGQKARRASLWLRLHRCRWYVRWPVKWAAVGLVVLAVCFPYPQLLLRHLQHLRDPDAMINPHAPRMVPMAAELRRRIGGTASPRDALDAVQRIVTERIAYAFDWDTWGVVDYLPTVEEVLTAGREDCDGRAVLAASLLRNLGVEARLVADGAHMWVWTPLGETMSPHAVKTWEATDHGVETHGTGLRVLPKATAYGVAVFPLSRELVVAAALLLVLLRPGIGSLQVGASALLLAVSLGLLRYGGRDWHAPVLWAQYVGLLSTMAAVLATIAWRRTGPQPGEAAPVPCPPR